MKKLQCYSFLHNSNSNKMLASLRHSISILAFIVLGTISMNLPALGASVSVDRILKQQEIHVVSTEKIETITRFLFEMKITPVSVLTLAEYADAIQPKSKHAIKKKKSQSILFVINRANMKSITPEIEAALPCPTSIIKSNEVILYSRKSKSRNNSWEIMISAPNEKWFNWELNRFQSSSLPRLELDESGKILDRFVINRISYISTEGQDATDAWMKQQIKPGQDNYDYDYFPIDQPSNIGEVDRSIITILDRQKITPEKIRSLEKYMPKGFIECCLSPDNTCNIIAGRQPLGDKTDDAEDQAADHLYAIAAPSVRLLNRALASYSSLKSIPATIRISKIRDLSRFGRLALVVKSNLASGSSPATINDLAGKLTTALSVTDTGFQCVTRQDLKELIPAATMTGDSTGISADQLAKLRNKVKGTLAIAVIELSGVDTNTTYIANQPQCTTQPTPAFNKQKPNEPKQPSPDDSKGLFQGPKYGLYNGNRANDPQYIKDLEQYRSNTFPKYQREMEQYQREKQEHERLIENREMEWVVSISSKQSANVSGNLRIYDISNLTTDTVGQVVFSCPLTASAERITVEKSNRVVVRGETNRPDSMRCPDPIDSISDRSIISSAFQSCGSKAVRELMDTSLLPCDLPADQQPNSDNTHVTDASKSYMEPNPMKTVVAVVIGETPLAKLPAKGVTATTRNDAIKSAVANIEKEHPNAQFDPDSIAKKHKILSEGWNSQLRMYRVKISCEVQVPQD